MITYTPQNIIKYKDRLNELSIPKPDPSAFNYLDFEPGTTAKIIIEKYNEGFRIFQSTPMLAGIFAPSLAYHIAIVTFKDNSVEIKLKFKNATILFIISLCAFVGFTTFYSLYYNDYTPIVMFSIIGLLNAYSLFLKSPKRFSNYILLVLKNIDN
jgi:hypothetical protein